MIVPRHSELSAARHDEAAVTVGTGGGGGLLEEVWLQPGLEGGGIPARGDCRSKGVEVGFASPCIFLPPPLLTVRTHRSLPQTFCGRQATHPRLPILALPLISCAISDVSAPPPSLSLLICKSGWV